jgi:hypothetical protein
MSTEPMPDTNGLVVEEIPDRRTDHSLRLLIQIGNQMAKAAAVDPALTAEWCVALYRLRRRFRHERSESHDA